MWIECSVVQLFDKVKENKLLWIASLLWEIMKVQLQFTSIAKTNSDSDTDSYTHTRNSVSKSSW